MGIIEKITLDDVTMRALEQRARETGHSLDDEAAELLRMGLQLAARQASLLERSRLLRGSLPVQSTDSLTLLREDRAR